MYMHLRIMIPTNLSVSAFSLAMQSSVTWRDPFFFFNLLLLFFLCWNEMKGKKNYILYNLISWGEGFNLWIRSVK